MRAFIMLSRLQRVQGTMGDSLGGCCNPIGVLGSTVLGCAACCVSLSILEKSTLMLRTCSKLCAAAKD